MLSDPYDILIVGAGVAGSCLAYALATEASNKRTIPLRIALLDRSFAKQERVVGELLLPVGVASVKKIGLESCLDKIDTLPCQGLHFIRGEQALTTPFPGGKEGQYIDNGTFVMALRDRVRELPNVVMIEATVTELLEDKGTQRVTGVRASQSGGEPEPYFADLIVLANGPFSKFRTTVLKQLTHSSAPQGHYAGLKLKNVTLPPLNHVTYTVLKNARATVLYELPNNEYRVHVELRDPPPADIKEYITHTIVPQLPLSLRTPTLDALDTVRRVPHFDMPASKQGTNTKAGVFLLGDASNMRHPITGAGMTVALHDVVVLRDLLSNIEDFGNWSKVSAALQQWYPLRQPLASSINTSSVCLGLLLSGDSEALELIQPGVFNYFERNPERLGQFVALATGVMSSPLLLVRCALGITVQAIFALFTQPRFGDKSAPKMYEYPLLVMKALKIVWTAATVFPSVLWKEM